MTDGLVEKLQELLAKATPGPWELIPMWATSDVLDGIEGADGHVGNCETDHDAALIVALRNEAPTLLARIAEMEKGLEPFVEAWRLAKAAADLAPMINTARRNVCAEDFRQASTLLSVRARTLTKETE